ncbi:hypothetical protein [Brevifollis gellanilyticus]|uniref:Uncharacterized protein n=1 Tax=Brevifollis gellanilyticus TaxID=748831 RepID=A0A512MC22_9BACT|nr:hypothetical protein [Brevifollis gellanilyticus]GEP44290.1 hypothetical protein BGE01nite_35810 [Brevifollis gellanilyticus]
MKPILPSVLFMLVIGSAPLNFAEDAKGTTLTAQPKVPKVYTVPDDSLSPDGHYGVTVPTTDEVPENEGKNSLIEVKTGRVLADLQTKFVAWTRRNHGEPQPARWSKDGSLLLWEASGKWSPAAITLVKIEKGAVLWQIDVLKAAEQEILKATQKAKPKQYAKAKKENEGSGAAYPEGFTVDVKTEEKSLEIPLWISVILTSNPKGIEGVDALESYLLGTVDETGKFTVKEFGFELPKSPHFVDSDTFH